MLRARQQGALEATCARGRAKSRPLPGTAQTLTGQDESPSPRLQMMSFPCTNSPNTGPGVGQSTFSHQETLPRGWMHPQFYRRHPQAPPGTNGTLELKDQESRGAHRRDPARSVRATPQALLIWPQPTVLQDWASTQPSPESPVSRPAAAASPGDPCWPATKGAAEAGCWTRSAPALALRVGEGAQRTALPAGQKPGIGGVRRPCARPVGGGPRAPVAPT